MVAYAGRSAVSPRPTTGSPVQARTGGGSIISVDNLGHQEASAARHREGFYRRAYELFPAHSSASPIIGAGSAPTGPSRSPTASSTSTRSRSIRASTSSAAELHADHPSDGPRVSIRIDDGRAFSAGHRSARPDRLRADDSLRLTASHAALRLESFFSPRNRSAARTHASAARDCSFPLQLLPRGLISRRGAGRRRQHHVGRRPRSS